MAFWIGWLCGLGTAALHIFLWRRLLPRDRQRDEPTRPPKRRCRPVRYSEAERAWAQTRNFLRYDGTEMPVIKTYKEEIHE